MQNLRPKKCFTLVELFVVLAVISFLFLFYVSKVEVMLTKAELRDTLEDFEIYATVINSVCLNHEQEELEDENNFIKLLNEEMDAAELVITEENKSVGVDRWGNQYTIDYEADTIEHIIHIKVISECDESDYENFYTLSLNRLTLQACRNLYYEEGKVILGVKIEDGFLTSWDGYVEESFV